MLRASRNIWLRRPYPNKMPVPLLHPAPPCSPLPSLAPDPNPDFSPLAIPPLPQVDPNPARLSRVFFSSLLPCLPLVDLPVPPTDSSSSSSTDEGNSLSFRFCGFLPALGTEEHFLLRGRRGLCVVMDSVPSLLCSDWPCFAIVSF